MPTERVVSAVAALRAFVDANARQDAEGMRGCLTQETLDAGGFSGPMPPGVEFRMGEPAEQESRVIIPLWVLPVGAGDGSPPLDELRCVMVEERGVWKFDLRATLQPQMEAIDSAMEAAMGQIGEAMGAAMGAVTDALSATLSSAFGGHDLEPTDWLDAGEFPVDDEWIALPEFAGLPALTGQVSEAVGREIPIVCDLRGLLIQCGSDEGDGLLGWLDSDFCPGLAAAVELAHRAFPAETARLRSVRIEPAPDWLERCLVLDGPDLVYRVDLRDPAGWYSADELARIIPGVLTGLPHDPERYPADRGTLPRAERAASLETYREVVAPRLMRRLSGIVGRPVALDVEWGAFEGDDASIRRLFSWGLNRVLGAVAMSYPVGASDSPPEGWLRAIRIELGYGEREATLADGVLGLVVSLGVGERGCFYECHLCPVLFGEPIGVALDDEPGQAPLAEET